MEEAVWRSIAIVLDREIVSAIKYHLSPGVIYYVLIVVTVFDATAACTDLYFGDTTRRTRSVLETVSEWLIVRLSVEN